MGVAEAHRGGYVPEEGHQGLERDLGVDERCGVGVAELVGGDVSDAGGLGAAGEFGTHRVLGEPPSVVADQELCRPSGGVRSAECGVRSAECGVRNRFRGGYQAATGF